MANSSDKTIKYILVVILMAAFALRLKNIWFGYPLPLHPDEPIIVQSALKIISTGDLNPHNFLYPSLNIYLHAFLYKAVAVLGGVLRGIPAGDMPEIYFYLYGRALNVLFSTATIYVVYEIGRRLFDSWTGIAAACFIATSTLHVTNSYYVTVDTSMAFWCTMACLMATLIYTTGPKRSYYIAGGVCVGLAIGCKYTAFPAFLPILIAHFCQKRHNRDYVNKDIILAAATVPAVFLLTTPYALLDYQAFFSALAYQKKVYSLGHTGAESSYGLSIGYYCSYLFTEGYGKIPSILALAGIPALFRQSRSRALLLLGCPLVLLVFLGIYKVYFPRNVVTLVPFLSLFSGYTVMAVSMWCGRHMPQGIKASPERAGWICGTVLVAIAVQSQVMLDVRATRENSLPDTRWISLLWCKDNIPAGANIGREYYTPPLEKYSKEHNVSTLGNFGIFRNRGMIPYLDFVITSSADYSRFLDNPDKYPDEASMYTEFFARNRLIKEFSGNGTSTTGPTIRIYQISRN